jgi:hypothetical protein
MLPKWESSLQNATLKIISLVDSKALLRLISVWISLLLNILDIGKLG